MLNEFKENEKRTEDVLVLEIEEKKTTRGSSYVICTVTDGETKVEVKFWNTTKKMCEMFLQKVVRMTIVCETYNGSASYVGTASVLSDKPVSDFIPKVPEGCEKMYRYMHDYPFQSEDIGNLVRTVLERNKEKLMYWAAAKSMHHALYGGLLYHMYRMTRAAETTAFEDYNIKKDIVVAGVILHDIGKLRELDTDNMGTATYTTEGRLFGHLLLGVMMVDEVAKELGADRKAVEQIEHIIASHHGRYEYGAIALPATKEAEIVNLLDLADSRMFMYEDAYKAMDETEDISDFVRGLDRTIIKF